MKKLTLSLSILLLILVIPAKAVEKLYYDIDFSSPLNIVDQEPTIDDSIETPSRIDGGHPTVVSSFGAFTNQPLLLNCFGNQTNFYYDSIRLDMDRGNGFYYTSFDVLTHNLIDSNNKFVVGFDLPKIHPIYFRNNGTLSLLHRKDISFQDDTPMHFEIMMDIWEDSAQIWLNDVLVYNDKARYFGDQITTYEFYNMDFTLGLITSDLEPDYSTSVALDNIIVANYIVPIPEPTTLLLLGVGGLLIRKRK